MDNIAVIGGGAAGLVAAWGLSQKYDVTVYEKSSDLGGHVNTIATTPCSKAQYFDNGFVVFNYETYPILTALLDKFGLQAERAKMSFSVSGGNAFAICENVKEIIFANKAWLLDPRVALLVTNIFRFNAIAKRDFDNGNIPDVTIEEYLKLRHLGKRIFDNYLGPVAAAVWVGSPEAMRDVPAKSFIHFFDHHRMLGFKRLGWYTIKGGASGYIKVLASKLPKSPLTDCSATCVTRTDDGVIVEDSMGQSTSYDQVVFACHADSVLELLANPSAAEQKCLETFQFVTNRSICHRDPTLMPERKGSWTSWNCHYKTDHANGGQHMAVNYYLNSLHKADRTDPVFLTISPHYEPAPGTVIKEYDWSHVLFNKKSVTAQKDLLTLQGKDRIWYAGSWRGYGFHEDAVGTGLTVARDLGCEFPDLPQWQPPDW